MVFRFSVALLALSLTTASVLLHRATTDENRVDGEYILVFLQNTKKELILNYFTYANNQGIVLETFQIGDSMSGAFAILTPSQLEEHLKFESIFDYIQENIIYTIQACENQQNSDWNLERCSERTLYLGDHQGYTYPTQAGEGVTSYIIDTGIYIEHQDFEGRAYWGYNSIDNHNQDCHGHGTHVAGIVAGRIYGVAKKTTVVAVKVFSCQGIGTTKTIILAIEWVTSNHKKPANANISFATGSNDPALVQAITASINAGIPYAIAAGNENNDACRTSPGNTPTAIIVGSTGIEPIPGSPNDQQRDIRSSFSNYGNCVKIFAPGTLITAPWIGAPNAIRTMSGTSMSCPHIAGLVSLIQGETPNASPAEIQADLYQSATNNVIVMNCPIDNTICPQSPNRLAYHGCTN